MIRTAVIGIGGFGRAHLDGVRRLEAEGLARLVAAAQPSLPGMGEQIAALRATGVPVYEDWREMLACERPEAVTIAAPVALHEAMASGALASGAHVLLEKPPLPSVAKVRALASQAEAAGRVCAVDFQMLSGGTTRDLKAMVCSGALGPIRRVTGVGLWKRLDSYYESSPWHGRLRVDGEWSLAGPCANALGHVLNQCLYFASPEPGFAQPELVEAELFCAHPGIENEDTAALRIRADAGVQIGFYVTFCAAEQAPPWIEVEGERAVVRWEHDRALDIRWRGAAPERREYGPADAIDHVKMFRNFARAAAGLEPPICPIAATEAFTAAVTAGYEAGGSVRPVPPAWVERTAEAGSVATVIRGVEEGLLKAAAAGALLTEASLPWVSP